MVVVVVIIDGENGRRSLIVGRSCCGRYLLRQGDEGIRAVDHGCQVSEENVDHNVQGTENTIKREMGISLSMTETRYIGYLS